MTTTIIKYLWGNKLVVKKQFQNSSTEIPVFYSSSWITAPHINACNFAVFMDSSAAVKITAKIST